TFDSQFVLLLHFAQSQQWTKVLEQLEKCEKLSGKAGFRWIRNSVLAIARRHEELRTRIVAEAAQGVAGAWKVADAGRPDQESPSGDEMFLAGHLVSQGAGVLEFREQMTLLKGLKPVYERQPEHLMALKGWKDRRIGLLQSIGEPDTALREMKQLAVEYSRDWNLQQRYAQMLFSFADYDAAYAWLTKTLADNANRQPSEEDNLRSTFASFLQQQGRYAELADFCAKWVERS